MRFLILDTVPGQAPTVQKEGARLFMALRRLGHDARLMGPGFTRRLRRIESVAPRYDVCVLTDNYPELWPWHDYASVRIPKVFWAVDTHLLDFDLVVRDGFAAVLFNNHEHIARFRQRPGWESVRTEFFPYAVDPAWPKSLSGRRSYRRTHAAVHDVVFCGGLTPERSALLQDLIDRGLDVRHLEGFGQRYVDNILSGRVNINLPIRDDFNGKILEVMGLRRPMLTAWNANTEAVLPRELGIYYDDAEELGVRLEALLREPDERTAMVSRCTQHVLAHHTYDHRAAALVALARSL